MELDLSAFCFITIKKAFLSNYRSLRKVILPNTVKIIDSENFLFCINYSSNPIPVVELWFDGNESIFPPNTNKRWVLHHSGLYVTPITTTSSKVEPTHEQQQPHQHTISTK